MSAARSHTRRAERRRSAEGREHPREQVLEQHDAPRPARGLTATQLLTAQQLAERWQVPKGQIYRLTRTGAIPVVKVGRYFRYRLDAIEAWEEGDAA